MAGGQLLEVEVKFWVEDLTELRERVMAAGGELVRERVFERNVRFDTAENRLMEKGELLRLREDTAVTLTYKSPPSVAVTSQAKVREELEITVSDFKTAEAILTRLGFFPCQIYEKYRETFRLKNVEIVLDEMPFGHFVELEGPEPQLKPCALSLGLNWENRILANYLALFNQLKLKYNLPFNDLTFANFDKLQLPVAKFPW
ncbi:MAG: class IV adenylate cyclase [Chloroflexi bacterium]|nr:MAG: class IV adenylate cyclase [Chloroflexota bacterium]